MEKVGEAKDTGRGRPKRLDSHHGLVRERYYHDDDVDLKTLVEREVQTRPFIYLECPSSS